MQIDNVTTSFKASIFNANLPKSVDK